MGNLGRLDEAVAEEEKAYTLDPFTAYLLSIQGTILVQAGRPDEALPRYHEAMRLNPRIWLPHCRVALALIDLHQYDEAVAESRKAVEINPAQTNSLAIESFARARMGERDNAQKILDDLLKRSQTGYVPQYHIAIAYMGLGDRENALTWLEKAYSEHDPKIIFLRSERFWDEIRSEPRFVELLRRMNLES